MKDRSNFERKPLHCADPRHPAETKVNIFSTALQFFQMTVSVGKHQMELASGINRRQRLDPKPSFD
jgi:hypothetical protein